MNNNIVRKRLTINTYTHIYVFSTSKWARLFYSIRLFFTYWLDRARGGKKSESLGYFHDIRYVSNRWTDTSRRQLAHS